MEVGRSTGVGTVRGQSPFSYALAIVDRSALDTPPLDGVSWSNATAAARLDAEQAKALEALIAVARPHPVPVNDGESWMSKMS